MNSRLRVVAALVVWGIVAGSVGASFLAVPDSASAAVQEDETLSLVNEQRSANGQAQLIRDSSLDSAAEEWALHLSKSGTFEHSTSEWRSARIPSGWTAQGENIARGYGDAAAVMDGWMNSPGHRENILRSSFTRIGIGYVAAGHYWVQIFAGYPGDTNPPLSGRPTPVIAGSATVGQTLTVTTGTWEPAPVTTSIQWNRNGVPIVGATGLDYRLGAMDAGSRISVTVTGSKPGFARSSMTSASTGDVVTDRSVERVGGADRYSVSVAVADRAYPATADVVFIATGENYPDALSAGPAAAHLGGPLLLTPRSALPEAVRQKIIDLKPNRIVVVGGPNAVSESVVRELELLQPRTERVGGADRFAVSRSLLTMAFGDDQAALAYIVTGNNFPDALGASAAAGALGSPVLLVNGSSSTVDTESMAALTDAGVDRVKLVGGAATVSTGIESALRSVWPETSRISGPDRYSTSSAVMMDAYPGTSSSVMLATGSNFPDALSGSAWAGKEKIPLYLAPTSCVPASTLSEIYRLGASSVVLLGGPAALSTRVEKLIACE